MIQQIEIISRAIYSETIELNQAFKKAVPDMQQLNWEPWDRLFPEVRFEFRSWISYLLINDMPEFDPDERHMHSVEIKKSAAWQPGEQRDCFKKTDPFLLDFAACPDWFQSWGKAKDILMIIRLKEALRRNAR